MFFDHLNGFGFFFSFWFQVVHEGTTTPELLPPGSGPNGPSLISLFSMTLKNNVVAIGTVSILESSPKLVINFL